MERLLHPPQYTGLQPPQQLGPLRSGTYYAESGVRRSDPGTKPEYTSLTPDMELRTRPPLASVQPSARSPGLGPRASGAPACPGLSSTQEPRYLARACLPWYSSAWLCPCPFQSRPRIPAAANPCALYARPLPTPASNPAPPSPPQPRLRLRRLTLHHLASVLRSICHLSPGLLGSPVHFFSRSSPRSLQGPSLSLEVTAYLWVHESHTRGVSSWGWSESQSYLPREGELLRDPISPQTPPTEGVAAWTELVRRRRYSRLDSS